MIEGVNLVFLASCLTFGWAISYEGGKRDHYMRVAIWLVVAALLVEMR